MNMSGTSFGDQLSSPMYNDRSMNVTQEGMNVTVKSLATDGKNLKKEPKTS